MNHPDDADGTKDWRGTPITEGARCIYAATVGRSTELVEGEVVGFTKSGRVNVRVVRRAYQGGWSDSKRIVHVGNDRLLIMKPDGLPETDLPTFDEKIKEAQVKREENDRIYKTHSGPSWGEVKYEMPTGWGTATRTMTRHASLPCSVCGDLNRYTRECPGGPS